MHEKKSPKEQVLSVLKTCHIVEFMTSLKQKVKGFIQFYSPNACGKMIVLIGHFQSQNFKPFKKGDSHLGEVIPSSRHLSSLKYFSV